MTDAAVGGGLVLILGGARSGKSRHAEAQVELCPPPWTYVATADLAFGGVHDAEMNERVARHRARRGAGWETLEAPLALTDCLNALPSDRPVLVDCLTLWLTNHLLADHDLDEEAERLERALAARTGPTFCVANEVGFGIVPDNALARRFRDAAGLLNQRLARRARAVVLVVAGLPLIVKEETP
ncbi:bifunctional adenosylcobinamide kinase/adenosylcobinamide-phosphate guanylyltransferase [Xanthobacter sp. KR7-65]|uniref:bifunctional adenosylcobinamide kinase/adenosylcobinamide-phosphate guanylyltransferase n=1 Tax=Xanthobacter sp. KR7-65 TaxID=3156612 RepID=UPI0032B3F322